MVNKKAFELLGEEPTAAIKDGAVGNVAYYFDANISLLEKIVDKANTILITDENIFHHHQAKFEGWKTIVIKAGEQHKQQGTVDHIIGQLISLEATRKTFIVGIGGGVVTDITGYAASVYMRGLEFGFVPTTILAMVDAAIGGKNGVDVGLYKNLVGQIKQPEFLLFDNDLLQTLPQEQWINGFAEIIKHAAIKNSALFELLENNSVDIFKNNETLLSELVQKNVAIKTSVVLKDEFEQGDRKLLNFGHTFGHAIENEYQLLHGHAISIGMMIAAKISAGINGFSDVDRLKALLEKYGLPTELVVDKEKVLNLLSMDKKRVGDGVSFIVLNRIGEAAIQSIPLNKLQQLL